MGQKRGKKANKAQKNAQTRAKGLSIMFYCEWCRVVDVERRALA
jgi:hypothetical protein